MTSVQCCKSEDTGILSFLFCHLLVDILLFYVIKFDDVSLFTY